MGAGDRDRPPAGHHRRPSASARCRTRSPRRAGLDQLGVVARGSRWRRRRCRRRRRCSAACPTCTVAPSARSAARATGVLGVAAGHRRCPRASMMRAMPDMPAPPMPMKCTRPSVVGRDRRSSADPSAVLTTGSLRGPPRRPPAGSPRAQVDQPLVGVPAPERGRGAGPSPPAAPGSASSGVSARRTQLGRCSAASSTSSPPPARHDRRGVEPLLAVADRQRHVDRGQPDRGRARSRCSRPARHSTRSAAA